MNPMRQFSMFPGVIAFLAAAVFPLVPKRFRKHILTAYLAVIAYFTLFRGSHDARLINLQPLWSYRKWNEADFRWQICMNYFLFVPYGAILKSIDIKRPILIAFLTSTAIEATQYLFCLGMCEIDDVINNTLGAVLGCLTYWTVEKGIQKYRAYRKRTAE